MGRKAGPNVPIGYANDYATGIMYGLNPTG